MAEAQKIQTVMTFIPIIIWQCSLSSGLLQVGNQVGAIFRLLQAGENHLGACG